jgi:hypothetical protein
MGADSFVSSTKPARHRGRPARWRLGAVAAFAALLLVGCRQPGPPPLIRYHGQSYGVELLEAALRGRPLGATPAELDATLAAALREVELQLWAAAQPLDLGEEARIASLARAEQLGACANLELKRRLAPLDLEELAREEFERDPEAFELPETVVLQMIFLPATQPGGARLAGELLEAVRRDPSRFAELAARHSESATAARGGVTEPLPGTALHPQLRDAIRRHRSSGAPFLVETERGCYVLRLLAFTAGVKPTLATIRPLARERAQQRLEDELFAEVAAEVERTHRVEVNRGLFLLPDVAPEEVVYRLDDTLFRVRDVVGGRRRPLPPTGPQLREGFSVHQRWQYFAIHFGCAAEPVPELDPRQAAALRVEELVRRFAVDTMRDRVAASFERQRGAFRHGQSWRIDLAVLPFRSRDPYADLLHYRPLVETIRAATNAPPALLPEADGPVILTGVELDENRLLDYEPALLPVLVEAEPGVWCEPLRSLGVRAFLLLRAHEAREARPFDLAVPEDFDQVLSVFLVERREEVLDALQREIERELEVDRRVLENLRRRLVQTMAPSPAASEGGQG